MNDYKDFFSDFRNILLLGCWFPIILLIGFIPYGIYLCLFSFNIILLPILLFLSFCGYEPAIKYLKKVFLDFIGIITTQFCVGLAGLVSCVILRINPILLLIGLISPCTVISEEQEMLQNRWFVVISYFACPLLYSYLLVSGQAGIPNP
jgi:hypothetical protein